MSKFCLVSKFVGVRFFFCSYFLHLHNQIFFLHFFLLNINLYFSYLRLFFLNKINVYCFEKYTFNKYITTYIYIYEKEMHTYMRWQTNPLNSVKWNPRNLSINKVPKPLPQKCNNTHLSFPI